jgi:hypothetical protein
MLNFYISVARNKRTGRSNIFSRLAAMDGRINAMDGVVGGEKYYFFLFSQMTISKIYKEIENYIKLE